MIPSASHGTRSRQPSRSARAIVGGRHVVAGTGRERAVWALDNFGIRAGLAPSCADIFNSNALKGGLRPVRLPEPVVALLAERAEEAEEFPVVFGATGSVFFAVSAEAAAFAG